MTENCNPAKKVIFTMGGKGGTGKTTFLTCLAEWFAENEVPCVRLDLDTENKLKGSFCHFFNDSTAKIDVNTRAGLDAFVDYADSDRPIILADMGAGAGKVAYQWFDAMFEAVANRLTFTAVGVVTSDPASVESVLTWAARLQSRVGYLVVLNKQEDDQAQFEYWEDTAEAKAFRKAFKPAIVKMESRIPDLQHAVRNHGVTLGAVARREAGIAELTKSSVVVRAQAYRKQLFAEFERVRLALLP